MTDSVDGAMRRGGFASPLKVGENGIILLPTAFAITESIDEITGRGELASKSEAGVRGVIYSTYDGVAIIRF